MRKVAIAVIIFTMAFSAAVFAKNDAIEAHCNNPACHSSDTVYNASKRTPARWDSTFTRMVRHGLKVTADQEKEIKDYLYTLVP